MRKTVMWIALAVMGLALALRLHGLDWGLPQVYEEAYPLKKSWPMWGWGTHPFDLNPKFFNYPSFYLYIQMLGQAVLYGILRLTGSIDSSIDFRLLYVIDPTPFYLMGRSITTTFAVATVGVTFWIGKRVASIGAGAMAATLVAVNGFHIAKSQVIEVDVPLTLFVMLTGWFAIRIPRDPRMKNYLLAGLFAGLATSTKYSGGMLPLMILLAHAVALVRQARQQVSAVQPKPAAAPRRRGKGGQAKSASAADPTTRITLATLVGRSMHPLWRNLFAAGGVCIVALLVTSPYILLDWPAFKSGFNYERTHMQIGHFGLSSTPAILWYARVVTEQILGWPLAVLSLAGLVWVVGVQKRVWAAILAIFPIVYVLVLSSWSMKAARYILPIMPIACLLASVVTLEVLQRLRRLSSRQTFAIATTLTVLLALPVLAEYKNVLRRSRGDTRTLSRQWILDNIPAGAYLVTEAYGPEPLHAIQLVDMSPDLRTALDENYGDVPIYAVLQIPMLQVRSELVAPFYKLEQYRSADYLITSSRVRNRYINELQRYAPMIAFYEELTQSWELVQTFPGTNTVGPEIRIYKNPQQQVVLGERGQVLAPGSFARIVDPGTGLVAPHMQRIGANLEVFGYYEAAAEAYELALTYPPFSEELEQGCVLRAMQARMRIGQKDRALQLLEAALASAKSPAKITMWETLRTRYFTESEQPAEPTP
jgi:4-amino-4-deoxy-L-arabinose transferase-like glycosyltransferase